MIVAGCVAAGLLGWWLLLLHLLRQPGARDIVKPPPVCFLCNPLDAEGFWLCDTHRGARYNAVSANMRQLGLSAAEATERIGRFYAEFNKAFSRKGSH